MCEKSVKCGLTDVWKLCEKFLAKLLSSCNNYELLPEAKASYYFCRPKVTKRPRQASSSWSTCCQHIQPSKQLGLRPQTSFADPFISIQGELYVWPTVQPWASRIAGKTKKPSTNSCCFVLEITAFRNDPGGNVVTKHNLTSRGCLTSF